MTESTSPLAELRKLVIAQKTALLPPEAASAPLETAHAALQAYDQLVSQAVIAAIQQRPIEVPGEQIRAAQATAQTALEQPDLPAGRDLSTYRNYLRRIDRMAELIEMLR